MRMLGQLIANNSVNNLLFHLLLKSQSGNAMMALKPALEARYQAILKHIQPDEYLVTAHHLNDQTETFFLALKRGAGLQGLGAMQKESQLFGMPILRPLLSF